jgi:hypothetical protein
MEMEEDATDATDAADATPIYTAAASTRNKTLTIKKTPLPFCGVVVATTHYRWIATSTQLKPKLNNFTF